MDSKRFLKKDFWQLKDPLIGGMNIFINHGKMRLNSGLNILEILL